MSKITHLRACIYVGELKLKDICCEFAHIVLGGENQLRFQISDGIGMNGDVL